MNENFLIGHIRSNLEKLKMAENIKKKFSDENNKGHQFFEVAVDGNCPFQEFVENWSN